MPYWRMIGSLAFGIVFVGGGIVFLFADILPSSLQQDPMVRFVGLMWMVFGVFRLWMTYRFWKDQSFHQRRQSR